MKFNKNQVKNATIAVGGMVVGAIASRIGAGAIPLKNETLKHGLLMVAPLLLAGAVKNKMVQNVALGASATQAGYLIKAVAGKSIEGNETAQKALGCPGNEPIIIYANEANGLGYYSHREYDEYELLPEHREFLAGGEDRETFAAV